MTPAPALPPQLPMPPSAYAPAPAARAPLRAPSVRDGAEARPVFQIVQKDAKAAPKDEAKTSDDTAETATEETDKSLAPALPIVLPTLNLATAMPSILSAPKSGGAIGGVNSLAGQVFGGLAGVGGADTMPTDPTGFAEDLLAALGGSTQQLASTAADAAPVSAADALQAKLPELDLSKESAWLDRLARDITATASDTGKLSFRLIPPQLGKLDITVETRSEGVAVQMTAETREARSIIAAAQPKLTEALGAQGIRVAEASVTSGRGEEMPRNRHLAPIQLIETALDIEADAETQRPARAAGRFA